MLPLNSASGPDGFPDKTLRGVPVVILRALLNLLMMLCQAKTIFIARIMNASQPSGRRPITISHVLVRLLHKETLIREKAASRQLNQNLYQNMEVRNENNGDHDT